MNETLRQALSEIQGFAAALEKRVKAEGDKVPTLILAKALLTADKVRATLQKTSAAIRDAAAGGQA